MYTSGAFSLDLPFDWVFKIGFVFIMIGVDLGFVWYTHMYLGKNWSNLSNIKKKIHILIRVGPYLLGRHPLYTGISVEPKPK